MNIQNLNIRNMRILDLWICDSTGWLTISLLDGSSDKECSGDVEHVDVYGPCGKSVIEIIVYTCSVALHFYNSNRMSTFHWDSDLYPPGSAKNVHQSSFPQSRISSTSLLVLVSFILFSSMQSTISPLLKKPTLDKDQLSSYCPISNLSHPKSKSNPD